MNSSKFNLARVFVPITTVVISLFASGLVIAQEELAGAPQWTPELSMKFRRIQGTAISADASHVAYIVNTPLMDGEQSEFETQVWVVTADGSRNLQYTRGEFSATAPALSPNGEFLSFISKRGNGENEKSQIWIMPLFGGEARQLTAVENNVSSYRWSPEGDRIAFSMQDPLSKERQKEIDEKRDVILVDQQPRYRHLHVVSMDSDGAEPVDTVQITSGEMVVGNFNWSPAGDEIAFAYKPKADLNEANLFGDISVVTVPSAAQLQEVTQQQEEESDSESLQIIGEVRPLLRGYGVENNPHWSPDGNWVAYTSSGSEPNLISMNDVYVIPASGGDSRRLAETPNRDASIIGWSKDSDELILSELMGTHRAVIVLPLRGNSIRTLTPDQGVIVNV